MYNKTYSSSDVIKSMGLEKKSMGLERKKKIKPKYKNLEESSKKPVFR